MAVRPSPHRAGLGPPVAYCQQAGAEPGPLAPQGRLPARAAGVLGRSTASDLGLNWDGERLQTLSSGCFQTGWGLWGALGHRRVWGGRALSWICLVAGAAGSSRRMGWEGQVGCGPWLPRVLTACALTEPRAFLALQVAGGQHRGRRSGHGLRHLASPDRVLTSLPSRTENSIWSEPDAD